MLGQTRALINVQCRGEDLTQLLSRDLVVTVDSSNELGSYSILISFFYPQRKSPDSLEVHQFTTTLKSLR